MKQISTLLILLALNSMPLLVKANELELAVQKIEFQWAHIHSLSAPDGLIVSRRRRVVVNPKCAIAREGG
ncbi:hypothetical protein BMR02_10745 [Methylococcaceae bacterium HT1]|nr:hypothetical protein BMR02_10745 [Methylococcaceae bacterium HT1]